MSEFKPTGKNLGEGKVRGFFEVELSSGDEDRVYYAATRPVGVWKERFLGSAEFELARLVQSSLLRREDHRLVLPLSFRKVDSTPEHDQFLERHIPPGVFDDQDLTQIEIYYPQITDGRTLLDVITKSEYQNGTSYLPTNRILTIVQDIATGIDTMKRFNFVSHDIKMSNILLEVNRAWVADFNVGSIHSDNTDDRRKFFHLVQVLLVGREIDKLFLSGRPQCSKEHFLQGLRTLENISPIETKYVVDTDGTVKRIMIESGWESVQLLIDKYWQDQELSLVDFYMELAELIGQ